MRPQRPISEEARGTLEKLLKKTKTKADFQRVQCLWLRAKLSLSSSQVAQAIGWSSGTVKRVWSRYFTEGEKALIDKGRGGRHHDNLKVEEEERILAHFFEKSKVGGVLVVNDVKATYEEVIGHTVPKSTIYRMLTRHEWRKIAPDLATPKLTPKSGKILKKTSTHSG